MTAKKIAIIGSGNPLFRDEGVGLYLALYLQANYTFSKPIEFVDGTTLGVNLQSYIQEYDQLIIINTNSDPDLQAGTLQIKDVDSFLQKQQKRQTANEVIIAEMLQVCMMAGDIADILFITITPEDLLSVEVGLSETLILQWKNLLAKVLDAIKSLEITYKQTDQKSLQEIINAVTRPY